VVLTSVTSVPQQPSPWADPVARYELSRYLGDLDDREVPERLLFAGRAPMTPLAAHRAGGDDGRAA
jgi:hypothetical protein